MKEKEKEKENEKVDFELELDEVGQKIADALIEKGKRDAWDEYMKSEDALVEIEEYDKFVEGHWVNDLLDAPHALIAVVETKIARVELGAKREVREEILEHLKDDSPLWQSEELQKDLIEIVKKAGTNDRD
jgi:hypothetical protein